MCALLRSLGSFDRRIRASRIDQWRQKAEHGSREEIYTQTLDVRFRKRNIAELICDYTNREARLTSTALRVAPAWRFTKWVVGFAELYCLPVEESRSLTPYDPADALVQGSENRIDN